MPARFIPYDRLEGPLAAVLDTLGKAVAVKSAQRRRREAGLARRPSEFPYLRSAKEVEAAQELEARKFPEPRLLEPPTPAPYVSPEDLLTERLKKVPLVDTSKAEQLPLLPLPAE